MIKRITSKGLFGLYDYDIPFSEEPAVKILTGPNGYGKTTLVLAISHLYKGDFWYFHFLDFQELTVYLSEPAIEQQIVIKKQIADNSSQEVINQQNSLLVNEFDDTDEEIYEEVITLQDDKGNEIESVVIREAYIQELLSSFRRRMLHDSRGFKDEELFSMYYDAIEDDYIQFYSKNISLALQEYETLYLPAQRVYNREQVGAHGRMARSPLRPCCLYHRPD